MHPSRAPRPSSRAWTELLHAEVAHLLGRSGVPVLHIKGPTVALWLYEAGERWWGDVDVLVPPDRLDDALTVLAAAGLVERYPGVNRNTTTDHAVTLARTDPDIGRDEVDVHHCFEGMDADPERTFTELWRRREPAQLAHSDVWFPDHSSRALLVVLNAARSSSFDKPRSDLARLLDATTAVDWADVVALADRVGALPALRAGLELEPAGAAVVQRTSLVAVEVTAEWRLRLAGAPRTALRLDELRRMPWSRRLPAVGRWLMPAPAVLRMRDPRVGPGRGSLAAGYLRRLGDGGRVLPESIAQLRRSARR